MHPWWASADHPLPARPTLAHGKICHIELPAADAPASAAFYERVFGWKVRRDGAALVFDDRPKRSAGTGSRIGMRRSPAS